MDSNVAKLIEDIARIEKKVDAILYLIEHKVEKNCNKMGEHIDFVESVYENVKHPLDFICSKVNTMISHENRELEHS